MRPFSSLALRPCLILEGTALELLRTAFHQASRRSHPDRFTHASDSERALAEEQSAQLNADYGCLRDPWSLIDRVLQESTPPENPSAPSLKTSLPPALAEEYFELQEEWTASAAQNFLARVRTLLSEAEAMVMALARQHPFQGFLEANETPTPPWTLTDLTALRAAVHQVRYFRSFARDIEQKSAIKSSA